MTPEKMTLICNIQGLRKVLCLTERPFKNYEVSSTETLRLYQNALIPDYNKALTNGVN